MSLFSWSLPTQATSIDPFIRRYFEVRQPVEIPVDGKGNTRQCRDNLNNLVAYFRNPVSYDGTDYNYC
ncbi:hypothetical protein [Planktothrix pseudagardhii]|nr:hypothetical protein [Planktothrix pseudagardhii]